MSLTGAVNGTNGVIIKIDGTESTIVGQMEFTTTFTGQPIDVSNKSSDDWVCLMDGELSGKGETAAGTILYNSDATYRDVRADTVVGTIGQYKVDFGDGINNLYFDAIPNALSDSVPMGDKIGSSLTFTSTGYVYGPSNPSLLFDFENGRYSVSGEETTDLYDLLTTASRASVATYFDENGTFKSAAANELRITKDFATGRMGALTEAAVTNEFLYSNDYSQVEWVKTASSVTSGSTASPDGTINAWKFVPDNGSDGFMGQPVSFTSGTRYTMSVFAKAAEFDELIMLFTSTAFGSNIFATFDLTNGTAVDSGVEKSFIEPVGNGWYRCSVTATATATISTSPQHIRVVGGDGSSGIYVWESQIEIKSHPTSQIQTGASQATRAKDNFSIDVGDWFSSTQGTLFANYVNKDLNDVDKYFAAFTDDTSANRFSLYSSQTVNSVGRSVQSGNDDSITLTGTLSANESVKSAISYDASFLFKGSSMGSNVVSSVLSGNSTKVTLNIGGRDAGAEGAGGPIMKITYVPIALTDEELEALTA